MQSPLLKAASFTKLQLFPPYYYYYPSIIIPPKKQSISRERNSGEKNHSSTKFRNGTGIRAMPCGSSVNSGENNGSFRNVRLNESTFLASLMPKKEIAADRFIEAHPNFDGRGVVIAIFDSGVDPAADGLQVTSDGKPKILDVLDCTGSGDIDTSTVVKVDADGCIRGASGTSLVVNSSWKNPSGEWHVGYKFVYELFADTLTSRLKKERKKKWDESHQEAVAAAVKQLDECDKKHTKVEDTNLKSAREDLKNRLEILRTQADSYDDKGPVIDAVVWYDGELWRVALDTQSLEDEPGLGRLADCIPLTNYRTERKYGVFSKVDACTFVVNVYDEGNVLSIVTDCSPHGTHVSGITAAFHPKEPLLNGVAPGAQLISCKIGDSRLGSMETGTGLTRAVIAAVEHKCDLVNMSYGEPTLLPDYGRFVDLVNEMVNKYHIVFVSSAGNNGPALSTVGAPGGTTSSIIGIGAYVSPTMAAGMHSVVEAPVEGLEYTWSSRGPTVDGELGVSVSTPGGAVAPVPTWTLQPRMLMNGTSMSSPCACGGIALLISAMKSEGIPVSPYSVRRAIENTCNPIGDCLEDKLSSGQGLLQVDKAFDYIQKLHSLPSAWYQIKINQCGKPSPTSRGIYLREVSSCQQSTEWTVLVEPKFHEDASNLDQVVPFEESIELHSTNEAVVRAPEYLLLTHNGRTFSIIVDPTNLSEGLHYYEVYGIDCKVPSRGPLFRIPVTITKPKVVENQPPQISFQGMSFRPGHIERRYIEVPVGATWVEATMRTSGFDTARRFFVDSVQISPLQRPLKWESVITFSSPSAKSFAFQVEGGLTMELAVAQFWSSGIGSHEPTIVDFEIGFHGINTNKGEVVLDGSDAPVRIDAEGLLASEKLVPAAMLNKVRIPYRPVDTKCFALSTNRDKLPSGKQILALILTYKFRLEDAAEIKPQIPLLNNRIYDNKFESQFYMISDSNKRVFAMGDVYPDSAKLPKGEYNLQLYLRHDNLQYLESMKGLVLFIERKLEEKEVIKLSFYSQPDGPIIGDSSFKSSTLILGLKESFYVAPPIKNKLPKNCPEGSVLIGTISYGKVSSAVSEEGRKPNKNPTSHLLSYIVPPPKHDEEKGKASSACSGKSVSERLEEEVRDAKIKVLASLNQGTDKERSEWKNLSISLKSEYPKYTPLLAKILEGLLSQSSAEDKIHYYEEMIAAADDIIDSIDKDELAKYFCLKSEPEDEGAENLKKKMETTREQLAQALYQKGLALSEIEKLKEGEKVVDEEGNQGASETDAKSDLFEDDFKELKKWVDVKSSKYGTLVVIRERRSGRLGTALKSYACFTPCLEDDAEIEQQLAIIPKALNDLIQDDAEPPKKKLYELKLSLLDQIGWSHMVLYEKQWMLVRFPPSLRLF